MSLSLAEINLRAIQFSKEWAAASRERAGAQTFWNEFFNVFGRSRKLVASFEEPVKNLKGDAEFIDLFWPGTLIAEHKSRGKDLAKANSQAIGYIHNLANTDRAGESPRYIIVSDFANIASAPVSRPPCSPKETAKWTLHLTRACARGEEWNYLRIRK